MENELNIYQKMLGITSELQTVAKNLTVGFGKSQYNAVSERDVIDAVKPLEAKYGVYSYAISREVLESHILESTKTTTDQKGNQVVSTSTTFMTRMKTVYRFVNTNNPEEYIDTVTFAEGIDTQDKGSGKAMTYADKYALMKAYKISTGDDPDQNASEPTAYRTKADEHFAPSVADYRTLLIKHCTANGKDLTQISEKYGLAKTATQADFRKAYESETSEATKNG